MPTYRLRFKENGKWQILCDIKAEDNRIAFNKAMLLLTPSLYDKPIRLEVVERKKKRKRM